jgi:hypothetical protein
VLLACICLTIRYLPRRLNGNKIQVCTITLIFPYETRSIDGDLDEIMNLGLSMEIYRRRQRCFYVSVGIPVYFERKAKEAKSGGRLVYRAACVVERNL